MTEAGESGPTINYDDVQGCKSDLEGNNFGTDCGIMVKVTVMTVVTVKDHIVGLFFIPTTARTGRIDGNVDVVTY